MSTRPTGDCTSTTCQRAPSWLWTTLLHQVCCSYTYPVEDGAALTLKKSFGLMNIIYFYMKRAALSTGQRPIAFGLTDLKRAEGLLVTGCYARKHLFLPQTRHRINVPSGRELLPWAARGNLLVVPQGGLNEKHRK